MPNDLSRWLPSLLGPVVIQVEDERLPPRETIVFEGVTAVDDPDNDKVTISVPGPPSGTGFRHVTSGTEDGATKLVENADVHASAAIAGSKISPDFGAQNIITTGFVSIGATPAGVGSVRLPTGGSIYARNAANDTDMRFASWAANLLRIGDGNFSDGILQVSGELQFQVGAAQIVRFLIGGTESVRKGVANGGGWIQIFDATTDVATPTGGPMVYAVAGALKARGTGGTIATLCAAELGAGIAHCPTCVANGHPGDFAQVWESPIGSGPVDPNGDLVEEVEEYYEPTTLEYVDEELHVDEDGRVTTRLVARTLNHLERRSRSVIRRRRGAKEHHVHVECAVCRADWTLRVAQTLQRLIRGEKLTEKDATALEPHFLLHRGVQ
jgi:hypothetical protein